MESQKKEKLYLVYFKHRKKKLKPEPVIAEDENAVRRVIAEDPKFSKFDIERIEFKESYFAWNHKHTGVYGPASDECWLD